MFLLKNLEKRRGLSFVRSALQQAPLKESALLKQWSSTGEIGLLRFLGTNKLPRFNPLSKVPLWDEVHKALATGMSPLASDFAALEAVLKLSLADLTKKTQAKGALIAAMFHEGYLMQVLPDLPSSTLKKMAALQSWAQNATILSSIFDKTERELLVCLASFLFFLPDHFFAFLFARFSSAAKNHLPPLQLTPFWPFPPTLHLSTLVSFVSSLIWLLLLSPFRTTTCCPGLPQSFFAHPL
jgi:hypothetical protein